MTPAKKQLLELHTPIPGLFAGASEPLPFAPALDIRAFLLKRERGNVLVCSTTVIGQDAHSIEDLGQERIDQILERLRLGKDH